MRYALALSTLLFAVLAAALLIELRGTWDAFNSFAVTSIGSSVNVSREIEAAIAAGDIEFAMSRLQRQQESGEYQLSEILDQLRSSSWRWNDQSYVIESAESFLDRDAYPVAE